MEHSIIQLLSKIAWSCKDFIDHGYGRSILLDKGVSVCERCSLQPEHLFHASIVRTPHPEGAGSSYYSMQIVNSVSFSSDGEFRVCDPALRLLWKQT